MSNKYPGGIITSGASVGSSVAFDGSNDYLQVGSNAAFNFSASDCTIECWFFAATTPGSETEIVEFGTGLTSGDIQLIWDSGGQFTFGGSGQTKTRYTFPSGRWYYLAAVKSGVNWYLYIDGVQYVTQTSGTASSSNYVNIGSRNASGNWVTGNIYNLRISNVARYSGATAAMANVLTTDANTKLLTCVGRTITDLSGNNFAITVGGNAYMSSYGPPGYVAYNPALGAATPGIWTVSDAIQAAQTRRWNMYDPYFNYTTLLLHGNGTNGAQNNTFLDSSSNNFTITRNGNTTQGTFSPFSQTGWSNNISDTGSMTLASSTDFDQTSAFTVEFWCYPTDVGTGIGGYIYTTNTTNFLSIYYSNSKNFAVDKTGVSTVITSSSTYALSSWYHIALCYDGTTTRFFVNGTSVGSISGGGAASGTTLEIGGYTNANFFKGYISNLRVVKGTALYTSNFTPSTTPLTDITNTKLLMCNSNRFADTNTQVSAKTITIRGTPSVQAFSPFLTNVAYTPQAQGGSGYFDGTGDYLTVANNTALQVGSGDFTIEGWYYPTNSPAQADIFTKYVAGSQEWGMADSSSSLGFYAGTGGASWTLSPLTFGTVKVNQWNHFAVCRSGNTFSTFLNGTRGATTTNSFTIGATTVPVGIGSGNGFSGSFVNGYLSNYRIVKGTAVYDVSQTSITVPTAPFTNITNTSLLCNFTNASVVDSTAKNVLETVGNAQISTTQSKFGGSSMYFDGTGDWLLGPSTQNCVWGTGDFTIEFWCYPTTLNASTDYNILDFRDSNDTGSFRVGINGTTIPFLANSVGGVLNGSYTFTTNNWYHFAVTRRSGTLTIWINGTSAGSNTTTTNFTGSKITVGAAVNNTGPYFGYLDDIRVTKGYARYTAAFTPQTSQWQDQ